MAEKIGTGWVGGYTQAHPATAKCSRCRRMVSKIQLRLLGTPAQKVCIACLRSDPTWTEAELRAAWGDR